VAKTKTKTKKTPALKPGLTAVYERIVPHDWTIASYNAVLPPVLSTPAMIGMMETAAAHAVWPRLPEGAISVGTRIEVDHLKAAPEGAKVRAKARLVKVDGRFLVFDVEARSGRHVLGSGRVFRAVVTPGSFLERAKRRSGKKAGKKSGRR
jgi:fluoroacetyl-CoA thioesterase